MNLPVLGTLHLARALEALRRRREDEDGTAGVREPRRPVAPTLIGAHSAERSRNTEPETRQGQGQPDRQASRREGRQEPLIPTVEEALDADDADAGAGTRWAYAGADPDGRLTLYGLIYEGPTPPEPRG